MTITDRKLALHDATWDVMEGGARHGTESMAYAEARLIHAAARIALMKALAQEKWEGMGRLR